MIFADLAAGDSVFLDANTFIYHYGPDPALGPACSQLLQRIENQELTPPRIAEAAELARAESQPLGDLRGSADYKRTVTEVYVRRALESAAARAGLNPN